MASNINIQKKICEWCGQDYSYCTTSNYDTMLLATDARTLAYKQAKRGKSVIQQEDQTMVKSVKTEKPLIDMQ